ncbi:helix-turn-helix domain-containing protein [Erwiniaceae bacterium BAC15a-03b]|uniref:Helix-turn-helix domain-containing protein n=1 Tax=Winslowiella arboricola TaxID=2978220 RepID=A0A9J6PKB8_9GAMM|nr:helix-turn-helix transcriptional regulator [Winslowiella arboricola]MCU5773087.1 helix-turn-helix domain-containing protein [Winslowiella arboricola]MCU5777818.1 helix-turn-helix domain-containing protein [Winslowiella arboricola]
MSEVATFTPFIRHYMPDAKTIAVLTTALLGTGSNFPMENKQQWQGYVQPRVMLGFTSVRKPHISTSDPLTADVRDAVSHLNNIKTVLSPSMTDLAGFIGVTRQAVYKWLSADSYPDTENLASITKLSLVADAFSSAGIVNAKDLIKMKAFNGRSLFDKLKSDVEWTSLVNLLINESRAIDGMVAKAKRGQSKAVPSNDWQNSISIPRTPEVD